MSTVRQSSPRARTWWRDYVRPALLAGLLIVAWLLWSGMFKTLLLGLGLFSCGLTIYVIRRMGYFDNELFAFRYGPRLLAFWGWLGAEMLRSSVEVARVVLRPKLEIDPSVVEIRPDDHSLVDKVLLGNSITLTPGTLTLDVQENRLLVHVLTSRGGDDLLAGEMMRRIASLRGT